MNVYLFKESYLSPRPSKLSTVMLWMKTQEKCKSVINYRKLLHGKLSGELLPEAKLPPVILFNADSYSGIILVEVDNLSGEAEAKKIKLKAAEAAQTLAAFTGVSGRSVKILTRYTLPDESLPRQREDTERFHAHAYRQTVNYYRMLLNREIPYQYPNPERGCRFSYDPELYFNPLAPAIPMGQPFQMPAAETWEEKKEQEKDPLERLLPGMERNRQVSFLYETSLKEALTSLGGFSSEDPKLFLVRLAENCCRSGIPEEDAVKWTKFHSELSEHEMEFRTTIRNVYLLGKNFGQKPCLNTAQQLALQLEEFMQRRYEFRRNELKKEVEYRERRSYDFSFYPVTDEVLNTFGLQAHAEGLNFWDRDIKRYVHSNQVPLHNPIDHYLNHLPEWDGKDHIRQLARTVPTYNENWPDFFYRWFLGMVAQWKQMNKMYANSIIPLLVGKQGCGKSTWCRKLIPEVLREYYTDSLDFGNKKNTELSLHRFALINLDEFDSINSHYQPYLKHLLQKPDINAIRPYKSTIQRLKRYGVFVATCNNLDLLTDPTGSRRYLCVDINGQIETDIKIDMEQVYAQAIHALQHGERYWFDKEEEQIIINDNTLFEQKPIEEQLFERYFTPVAEDEEGEWLLAIEIIQRLQDKSKMKFSSVHARQFGRLLKKNDVLSKHTNHGNFYLVKEVSENKHVQAIP